MKKRKAKTLPTAPISTRASALETKIIQRLKSRKTVDAKITETPHTFGVNAEFSDTEKDCELTSFEIAMRSLPTRDPFCMTKHNTVLRFQSGFETEGLIQPSKHQLLGRDGGICTFSNDEHQVWVAGSLDFENTSVFDYENDGVGFLLFHVAWVLARLRPPSLIYRRMEYETKIALELALPVEFSRLKLRAYTEVGFPDVESVPGEILLVQDLHSKEFFSDAVI
jgi:hypothetical protein